MGEGLKRGLAAVGGAVVMLVGSAASLAEAPRVLASWWDDAETTDGPPARNSIRWFDDADTLVEPPDDAADDQKPGWPGWAEDQDGVFTLAVFGDSLADGYWGGVYRKLARDEQFEILRRARNSTGLSRSDYYDWQAALEDYLSADPIDAVMISMGANDHQSIYLGDQEYLHYGSDGWDEAYQQRVFEMMSRLKEAGIPTFWLGLPVVRDADRAEAARRLNRLYAAAAEEADAIFIPLWDLTADENGQYASYLPDEDGRSRLMRANDGVHFTAQGYGLVADHVLTIMDGELALFEDAEEASE